MPTTHIFIPARLRGGSVLRAFATTFCAYAGDGLETRRSRFLACTPLRRAAVWRTSAGGPSSALQPETSASFNGPVELGRVKTAKRLWPNFLSPSDHRSASEGGVAEMMLRQANIRIATTIMG